MTISPQPAPQTPRRARYDWASIELGTWQRWLNLTGELLTDDEARKAAARVRLAGRDYAQRHNLTMASRREQGGRILDLKFEARP